MDGCSRGLAVGGAGAIHASALHSEPRWKRTATTHDLRCRRHVHAEKSGKSRSAPRVAEDVLCPQAMRAPLRSTSAYVIALSVAAVFVAVACGSSGGSNFNPNGGSSGGSSSGDNNANLGDSGFSLDALAAADPPNQWCGPDGGEPDAGTLGGSPDCPTDKNLQGCPCGNAGDTAACWPGLRKNRDVGICKDGTATCQRGLEQGNTWGPCVGAVLPQPGATTGPAACGCFSEGQWHIDNLIPFFVTYSDGKTYSLSTTQDPDGGATVFPILPTDGGAYPEPPPAPPGPWSTDQLSVDCEGTFTLSYELKAGDFNNPKSTDCSLVKVTLPATYYAQANVSQPFPILPAWTADATHTACANAFHNNGGYGEMSVVGESVLCQQIDNGSGGSFVFHRIQYCAPNATNCGQDGSGTFK